MLPKYGMIPKLFSFPLSPLAKICSKCVPSKFSWCFLITFPIYSPNSQRVPQHVLKSTSICPICFCPMSRNLCGWAIIGAYNYSWGENFYIGESLKFQNFFFMNKKEANCVKKILNLEGRHSDLIKMNHIRVIRKVRKTEHQNPEFGHIQGEIKKKPAKKYISIQQGMKLRKPSNWW